MDRAEAAANRIIDALERSETPRFADLACRATGSGTITTAMIWTPK